MRCRTAVASALAAAIAAGTAAQAAGPLDLAVVSTSIPARVAPGGSLAVTLSVKNTGSMAWPPGAVTLRYAGDGTWAGADLTIGVAVPPNGSVQVSRSLGASTQVGVYGLRWQPVYGGTTSFGAPVPGRTEVTCSNGSFCDGEERWNGSECVAGPDPCDDGLDCTVDTCEPASGRCTNVVPDPAPEGCVKCHTNCVPHCNGQQCGNDGCGGSCGTCSGGDVCIDFSCQPAPTSPGTCANPDHSILVPATLPPLDDPIVVAGDTTDGFNVTVPRCNETSPAPEHVYAVEVPSTLGLEVRTYGYDTVAHIRSSCLDPASTVACNDDGTPPGSYGSRLSTVLGPGTHYLMVDGYDAGSFGPFTMELRWRAGGCAPACDGKACGDDGCGGSCGSCPGGQCIGGQCVPEPCIPDCHGKKCGDDGCGGSCGSCGNGELCVVADGKCRKFDQCDHLRPVCPNGCNHNQFCGTDCECHKIVDPLPDLVVDEARLASDVAFDSIEVSPLSCSLVEGCVDGTGTRDLMRFSVAAVNQGHADLVAPPIDHRPDLFVYSPCHGHYHYEGFAEYDLLDAGGTIVRQGHKQAYCMEDSGQALGVQEGSTIECDKRYDCENQGVQRGWFDLYGNSLDCQWVDITGVPPGQYYLRVRLNPPRTFQEVSFDNNTAIVPVEVP